MQRQAHKTARLSSCPLQGLLHPRKIWREAVSFSRRLTKALWDGGGSSLE